VRWLYRNNRGTAMVVNTLFMAIMLVTFAGPGEEARADWPFGGKGSGGRSGLDLNRGYDVNTVVTTKGKVISLNLDEGGGPALIETRIGPETIQVIVGPKWFWKEHGIPVHPGDELTVHGALAEGKDGKRYLLTQKLTNTTTGREIVLRNKEGVPAWSWLRRQQ